MFYLNFPAFVLFLTSQSLALWKHRLVFSQKLKTRKQISGVLFSLGFPLFVLFCFSLSLCKALSILTHKFQLPQSPQLLESLSSPQQNLCALSQSALLSLRSRKCPHTGSQANHAIHLLSGITALCSLLASAWNSSFIYFVQFLGYF